MALKLLLKYGFPLEESVFTDVATLRNAEKHVDTLTLTPETVIGKVFIDAAAQPLATATEQKGFKKTFVTVMALHAKSNIVEAAQLSLSEPAASTKFVMKRCDEVVNR